MNELLQEFVNSGGSAMQIDRPQSVIRGVKLLGLESANGRQYLPQALANAIGLYEGAKVNVNHPKGSPLAARDYQDRLGSIRNVSVRAGQGLFGDLHFNPRHAIAEQLLWDAANAPQNVGLSHNVEARTARRGNTTVVEAILRVQSVDLVADPATTRGLYESEHAAAVTAKPDFAAALASLTLAQLQAGRADLVEAITLAAAPRLAALEAEIDRLQLCEALGERKALVNRILEEYQLPHPGQAAGSARQIVSERFVAAMLGAPDESAMRQLAEERAGLVVAARTLASRSTIAVRPQSREQGRVEPAGAVMDAHAFVRAIT